MGASERSRILMSERVLVESVDRYLMRANFPVEAKRPHWACLRHYQCLSVLPVGAALVEKHALRAVAGLRVDGNRKLCAHWVQYECSAGAQDGAAWLRRVAIWQDRQGIRQRLAVNLCEHK